MLDNLNDWNMSSAATPTIFPRNMRTIQRHTDTALFILSIIANSTLVALTLSTKMQGIRAYMKVILMNCAFDVFSTFTTFIFGMQMELSNGYFVMVMVNPLFENFPIEWYYFCVWLNISGVACAIHVIALTFYFRYVLVCKGRMLSLSYLIKLIAIPVFYAFGECGLLAYSFYKTSSRSDRAEVCRSILNHPIWWDEFGQPPSNCIITILMLAPFFTAFIPVANLLAFPVFHLSMPGIGLLISIQFAALPLMNPLIAIGFVGPFRRGVQKFLCGRSGGNKAGDSKIAVTSVTNQPSNRTATASVVI